MGDTSTCYSCHAEVERTDKGTFPRLCAVCKAKRRTWLIAGVVLLAIGGVVALGVVQLGKAAERDKVEKARKEAEKEQAIAEAARVAAERDDPDKTPSAGELDALEHCDPDSMRSTSKRMNRDSKFKGTIRAVKAYQAKCKRASLLDWDLLYAYEQLEQWADAEPIATALLREDPADDDFWWWRGRDRVPLKQFAGAVVDIRQSLAHSTEHSNGVQISYLITAAKAVGVPCEGAFALRWIATRGVELAESAKTELRQLVLEHGCDKLEGEGTVSWKGGGLTLAKTTGTIGDKPARFLIESVGTTLVSKALADSLNLARGAEVDVMTSTGLGKGAVSTAEVIVVGKATAKSVPVVIVDTLPDSIDAVIGTSFLWRFDVQETAPGEFTAKPLER